MRTLRIWIALLSLLYIQHMTSATSTPVYVDSHNNTVLDNGTILWSPVPTGSQEYKTNLTYDQGDLTLLFAFARSFINTVQPNAMPFDLIQQLMGGSFDISTQYMELVMYAMGFAITFALGVLFVLFLPLCGFCFCCCRCCGNCGGASTQSADETAGCKRMGLGLALLLMTLCMGASIACTFLTNDRFNVALVEVGDSVNNNMDDVDIFLNNTIIQFRYLAVDMYNVVAEAIKHDINGIGPILGGSIVSSLGGMVDPTLNSVIALHTTIKAVQAGLDDVNAKIGSVKSAGNTFNAALTDLSSDIGTTKTQCATCTPPSFCQNVDESVLSLGIDFNTLPDLSSVSSSMSSITSQNLTQMALDGRAILDSLPDTIDATVGSMSVAINSQLDDFAVLINTMVNDFVNATTGAFDFAAVKADIGGYIDLAKDYNVYRWYGGLGLVGVLGLICLCFLLGLCMGVMGSDKEALPTERGCMSNCGGCCLMLSVTIMFCVGSLLMLLTSVLFVVGGNMEKICQPLIDMTLFSEFLDKGGIPSFNIGEMLLQNSSIEFSLHDTFLGCRANKAPFKLMHFDSLIPLEDYMDYEKYLPDIETQFSSMSDAVDLSSVNIITPEMQTLLTDFRNSGAASVDFTGFADILKLNLTSFDFGIMADLFTTVGQTCPVAPGLRSNWDAHAVEMNRIDTTEKVALSNSMDDLSTSLGDLEIAVSGIVPAIDSTLSNALSAQSQLQNNVTSMVFDAAMGYKDRILGYVDQFADRALYLVYNELGACKPVWNLYESFTLILCKWTVDSLNGFWFGLGWGIFFFIPSLIVAVKLAKHYKRMDDCEGFVDEEDEYYDDYDDYDDDYKA